MPLTPEANLRRVVSLTRPVKYEVYPLDKLLGLDIVHPMNTSDTIAISEEADQLESSANFAVILK